MSKNKKGFTLIEVLVSLFLIAVGTGVFLKVWTAPQISKSASYKVVALKIASKQIENLRSSTTALSATSAPIIDSDLSLLPNASGTLTISTSSPGSSDGKLKNVSATVEWMDKGVVRSAKIDTLINK